VEPMSWDMKKSSGQLFMMMSVILYVSTMSWCLDGRSRIYEKLAWKQLVRFWFPWPTVPSIIYGFRKFSKGRQWGREEKLF
jgi:hypothetical protein